MFDFLFDDIGGKIKSLARVMCGAGMVVSFIAGIMQFVDEKLVLGCITIILGCISSWLGSFLLYGFGQLIQNSDILVAINTDNVFNAEHINEAIASLKELYENGDITEQEYEYKKAELLKRI